MWVKANLKALIGVAPFAGAWIEISFWKVGKTVKVVAPFAGAWIEIRASPANGKQTESRSLRGSVD